jgi:hypothetical protein
VRYGEINLTWPLNSFYQKPLCSPYYTNLSLIDNDLAVFGGATLQALAYGVRLLAQCLHDEPTPQQMAEFEGELNGLVREIGRRMRACVATYLAPSRRATVLSRVRFAGRRSRCCCGQQRSFWASLVGTSEGW